MSPGPSRRELTTWLVDWVGTQLTTGERRPEVDVDRPLTELGLSSKQAVSLAGELAALTGRSVDPTMAWRVPTIRAIVAELTGETTRPTTRSASVAPPAPLAGPLAVVGVGCRFPGADGPEEFWDLLVESRDAVTTVPEGRWEQFVADSEAERAVLERLPRAGGYLDDVAAFDAEHFGISAAEARLMDPQQRLLLEVAWEALEHAGIAPDGLRGSATGVFVGASGSEYAHLTAGALRGLDVWTPTGSALSVVANRLSYALDLRGPSATVDTACSSSLVALHQAAQSLQTGDSDLALVGGVNLLLAPNVTASFELAGLLAGDGRCKPFSADADGIVRAEGCGVVVLKRLEDAARDGDRVLALVRGTAVNSDGRSNGLMAPNQHAQEDVLERAYARAGVDPSTVSYVEAHGTGTLLGDPIEAHALGTVLGAGRPADTPLLLGSVKSNLGHLEAAAGVAGVIKTVLALHHGRLPASLHADDPNPAIAFEAQHLDVVRAAREWPDSERPHVAGVSGFGFGGTNAHVVLEQAPAPAPARDEPAQVHAVALSGPDAERLIARADAVADTLRAGGSVPSVVEAARRRLGSGPARLGVVAREGDLVESLRTVGAAGRCETRLDHPGEQPVWVFSGYGSHWPGMAARLLRDDPVFAAALDTVAALVEQQSGLDVLEAIEEGIELEGVHDNQLATFCVQVALASAWRSQGVEPAAVVGQSMGEIAAAVVSGGLSLRDGVRVMVERTRLLATVDAAGAGAMAVVDLAPEEVERRLADRPGLSIAVHASPRQCTVAGPVAAVDRLVTDLADEGLDAWPVPGSVAGHSPAVDGILDELRDALVSVRPRRAGVRMYSTVADDTTGPTRLDADYWVANVRRPVRFREAVTAAIEDGHQVFVEVSPHPVAQRSVRATADGLGVDAVVLHSLRRRTDDTVTFHANVLELRLRTMERLPAPAERPAWTDLPRTSWRHERHWFGEAAVVRSTATEDVRPSLRDEVVALTPTEARARLRDWLTDQVALVMGDPGAVVSPHVSLVDLGLDSLMATRARNVVQNELGLTLAARVVLGGATVAEVADQLADQLGIGGDSGASAIVRVGPRDPSERLVAQVWTDVLGTRDLAVDDAFDALGGGLAEMESVRERLAPHVGSVPTVAELLSAANLAETADLVRDAYEGNDGSVVRWLRRGGRRDPLFVFHPAGGPTSVYQPLVSLLDEEQPVVGFERIDDATSIEAKVERYLPLVREIQPHGPYRLMGWSFGGLLADALAERLGETDEVEVVAMIDTVLPLGDGAIDDDQVVQRYQRFVDHVEQTYGTALPLDLTDLVSRSEVEQVELIREALGALGAAMPSGVVEHQVTSYVDTRIAEHYTPRHFAGTRVLYRASAVEQTGAALDPRYQRSDADLGWGPHSARLEVVPVPGDHISMIDRPHVDVIAQHLDRLLDRSSVSSL